ncbi:MAG: hypothetical protein ACF8SC_01990 [Phycisphaerales bacterium JB037]
MSACPNCSAAAVGTEAASICTECATATVAGASFSLPMLLTGVLAAGVVLVAVRVLLRRSSAWLKTRQPVMA